MKNPFKDDEMIVYTIRGVQGIGRKETTMNLSSILLQDIQKQIQKHNYIVSKLMGSSKSLRALGWEPALVPPGGGRWAKGLVDLMTPEEFKQVQKGIAKGIRAMENVMGSVQEAIESMNINLTNVGKSITDIFNEIFSQGALLKETFSLNTPFEFSQKNLEMEVTSLEEQIKTIQDKANAEIEKLLSNSGIAKLSTLSKVDGIYDVRKLVSDDFYSISGGTGTRPDKTALDEDMKKMWLQYANSRFREEKERTGSWNVTLVGRDTNQYMAEHIFTDFTRKVGFLTQKKKIAEAISKATREFFSMFPSINTEAIYSKMLGYLCSLENYLALEPPTMIPKTFVSVNATTGEKVYSPSEDTPITLWTEGTEHKKTFPNWKPIVYPTVPIEQLLVTYGDYTWYDPIQNVVFEGESYEWKKSLPYMMKGKFEESITVFTKFYNNFFDAEGKVKFISELSESLTTGVSDAMSELMKMPLGIVVLPASKPTTTRVQESVVVTPTYTTNQWFTTIPINKSFPIPIMLNISIRSLATTVSAPAVIVRISGKGIEESIITEDILVNISPGAEKDVYQPGEVKVYSTGKLFTSVNEVKLLTTPSGLPAPTDYDAEVRAGLALEAMVEQAVKKLQATVSSYLDDIKKGLSSGLESMGIMISNLLDFSGKMDWHQMNLEDASKQTDKFLEEIYKLFSNPRATIEEQKRLLIDEGMLSNMGNFFEWFSDLQKQLGKEVDKLLHGIDTNISNLNTQISNLLSTEQKANDLMSVHFDRSEEYYTKAEEWFAKSTDLFSDILSILEELSERFRVRMPAMPEVPVIRIPFLSGLGQLDIKEIPIFIKTIDYSPVTPYEYTPVPHIKTRWEEEQERIAKEEAIVPIILPYIFPEITPEIAPGITPGIQPQVQIKEEEVPPLPPPILAPEIALTPEQIAYIQQMQQQQMQQQPMRMRGRKKSPSIKSIPERTDREGEVILPEGLGSFVDQIHFVGKKKRR